MKERPLKLSPDTRLVIWGVVGAAFAVQLPLPVLELLTPAIFVAVLYAVYQVARDRS